MLVEEAAQPHQLILVAQFVGRDDLVMLERIGLVIEPRRQVGHGPIGADRHHAFLAHIVRARIAVGLELVAIVGFALFGVAALVLGARLGIHIAIAGLVLPAIAVLGLILLILALILRFGLVQIGRHIGIDQLQMFQHRGGQLLERALVVDRQRQCVQVMPGLVLDPLIDHRHARRDILGDRLSGQPFAHLERQRGGQGHLVGRPRSANGIGF